MHKHEIDKKYEEERAKFYKQFAKKREKQIMAIIIGVVAVVMFVLAIVDAAIWQVGILGIISSLLLLSQAVYGILVLILKKKGDEN